MIDIYLFLGIYYREMKIYVYIIILIRMLEFYLEMF